VVRAQRERDGRDAEHQGQAPSEKTRRIHDAER
jgi:hypothetical protein